MAIKLPAKVAQQVSDLGKPLAQFKAGGAMSLIVGLVGILFFLAGLGIPLAMSLDLLITHGQEGPETGAIKMSVLLLLGGGGLTWMVYRTRGLCVFAFQGGLARVQKDDIQVVRWEDIGALRYIYQPHEQMGLVEGAYIVELVSKEGNTLRFNESLSGLGELRKLVEKHTLRHLHAAAVHLLRAGKDVPFGVLTASREGVQHAKGILSWKEIKEAARVKGSFTLTEVGARKSAVKVAVGDVPNYHILLALVEQLRKPRKQTRG